MKDCKYYIDVDGVKVTLNGDKELTEYISNNFIEQVREIKEGVDVLFNENIELSETVLKKITVSI